MPLMIVTGTKRRYVALTDELLEQFIKKGWHYFRCSEMEERREERQVFYDFEIGFYESESDARAQNGREAFVAAHLSQAEPTQAAEYDGQCRFWVRLENVDDTP